MATQVLHPSLMGRGRGWGTTRRWGFSLNHFSHCWSMAAFRKKAQQHGCRAVDGHRNRRCRVAEVEAGIKFLGVVEGADAHARIAHFAENVRSQGRVFAIERDGVESGRQAFGRQSFRDIMKPVVGTLGTAFARKHPRRVFAFTFERKHTRRIRKLSWYVLGQQPAQNIAPVVVFGQTNLR